MAGPEHNPADDVEPTKEEYEAWERERAAKPAEQYYQIQIRGDGDIGWGPLSARVTEGDQDIQKEWFNKVATEYHHSDDIRLVKVTVEVLGERAAITPKEKPNAESH